MKKFTITFQKTVVMTKTVVVEADTANHALYDALDSLPNQKTEWSVENNPTDIFSNVNTDVHVVSCNEVE